MLFFTFPFGKYMDIFHRYMRRVEGHIHMKLDIKGPTYSLMDTVDFSYIGVYPGNFWVYRSDGEEIGYGYIKDTIEWVAIIDTNQFYYCNYLVNRRYRLAYISRYIFTNSDSSIVGDTLTPDSLNTLISGEVIKKSHVIYGIDDILLNIPYSFDGVRFLKKGAVLPWITLDTCIYKPFLQYAPMGSDEDGDMIEDSAKAVNTLSRIVYTSSDSDTIITRTPITIRIKFTRGIIDSSASLVIDSADIVEVWKWKIIRYFGIEQLFVDTSTLRLYYHHFSDSTVRWFDTTFMTSRFMYKYAPPPMDSFRLAVINPPMGSNAPPNISIFTKFNHPLDPRTVKDTMLWVNGSGVMLRFSIIDDSISPLDKYLFMNSFSLGDTVKFKVDPRLRNLWGSSLARPESTVFYVSISDMTPPVIKVLIDSDTTDIDTLVIYQPYSANVMAFISDLPPIPGVADAWIADSNLNRLATLIPCDSASTYSNPDSVCVSISSLSAPDGIYKIYALARDFAGNIGKDSFYIRIVDTVSPYIISTFPSNGSTGVPNGTSVQITFNEPMKRNVFYRNSINIRFGSTVLDSTQYNYTWLTSRIISIIPRIPLPYAETVWVYVDSLYDLVNNKVRRDSFYFITQEKEDVFIDFVMVVPDSVFSGDSVLVIAQASSAFTIRGGKFYLNGSPYDTAYAYDGSFDETVETLKVYIRTDNLSPGTYTVEVEAYNDYKTSSRASATFKVLKKPNLLEPENVIVIPNPVKGSGKVRIRVGDDGTSGQVNLTIEVFSPKIKRVFHREITTNKLTTVEITLPELPPDLYILRVRAKDKKVEKWFGVIR